MPAQELTLNAAVLWMAIIVQLIGIGIAIGALRQTVKSLREIADATLARIEALEGRMYRVEDRATAIEVGCRLRHPQG